MASYRLTEDAKADLIRIYYQIRGEAVEIMAIIGQQDLEGWL